MRRRNVLVNDLGRKIERIVTRAGDGTARTPSVVNVQAPTSAQLGPWRQLFLTLGLG